MADRRDPTEDSRGRDARQVFNPPQDHGGDIYAEAGPVLMDFSASINPLGQPPGLLAAIQENWQQTLHYPDRRAGALLAALVRHTGLSPEEILTGNGSTEHIDLALRALAPKRVIVCPPDFGLYAQLAPPGTEIREVDRDEQRGFALDMEAIIGHAGAGDVVILSNPNNPSGHTHAAEELRALARALAGRGAILILDEAFADYSPSASILAEAAVHENLLVLCSMTKFYAIPGIRLGFLAGPAPLVERLRRAQPPWSTSALAQVVGVQCLADEFWTPRSLDYMAKARAKFAAGLGALPGFTVLPSGANYLLVRLAPPAPDADKLYGTLRADGILIRHCGSFGLGERYVRVAVRTVGENTDLVNHIKRHFGGHAPKGA